MKLVKLEDLRAGQKIIVINGNLVYGPFYYKYTRGNIFGEPYINCEDDVDQVFSLFAYRSNKYLVFEESDEVKITKEIKDIVEDERGYLSIGDTIYVFLPHAGYYQKTAVSKFIRLADGSLLVEWSDGNTSHWSKIEDCKRAE